MNPKDQIAVEPRLYQDSSDLEKMVALLQTGRQAQNGSYYVHVGDITWWLYYLPMNGDWWSHIYLWDDPSDPDRLLAWGLVVPDGDTFDIYVQPELRGSPQALAYYAWGANRAAEYARVRGAQRTGVMWIAEDDALMDSWLRQQGYARHKADVYLLRSLDEPMAASALPDGFVLRGSQGEAEVEARAAAQYSAFGNTVPFEPYVARFRRFMLSSGYDPELDVLAATSDGRIGAFCKIWPDPVNRVGLFEPVGTAQEFQRRGLGKAVMTEGLRRLQAMGMRQAIVCTVEENLPAVKLYESVGFRCVNKLWFYWRSL